MKIKNKFRHLVQFLTRHGAAVILRRRTPLPPPQQLDLGLDQITATGLPLRDALPVRSAEYWLQVGEPDLALKELQTLPETALRHTWPTRVRLAAHRQLVHRP